MSSTTPVMTCFFSNVTNTSGASMFFGFLPYHGQTLSAGQSFTVFGNITEAINRGKPALDVREHRAFLHAVASGLLTVNYTPAPIMQVGGTTKMAALHVSGGVYSVVASAPCWTTTEPASESIPNPPPGE